MYLNLLPVVPVVEVAHATHHLLLIPEAGEVLKGAGEAEDVLRHPRQQRSLWEEYRHEEPPGQNPIPIHLFPMPHSSWPARP